ncbi:MAG: tetratricopeptide repeat protein [Bacteroidales bacterium]|jgi:tetratricopeptide (TPR) repeat protein|nr:tetratricopeptide repeat protein [Bacteroidales bacterium]
MAKNKKTANENNNFKTVETAFNRAENFVETKQKTLIGIAAGILVIILAVVLYTNFVREPRKNEAWSESFKAEYYFEIDSFNLALYGDGFYPGFVDIVDQYGSTPMGNASKYYAGVCLMRIGEFESAIDYLEGFKSKDPMVGAMATNLIGDANMELGNNETALKNYLKAADKASNEFLTPVFLMKAGRTCELLGDYKQALNIYTRIEKEYHGTQQQREVEKFIERAKTKM